AWPPSARISVDRIWTMVVLPAPLGPSRAKTVPCWTVRSIPSSTRCSPNDLRRPVTAIAVVAVAACGAREAMSPSNLLSLILNVSDSPNATLHLKNRQHYLHLRRHISRSYLLNRCIDRCNLTQQAG